MLGENSKLLLKLSSRPGSAMSAIIDRGDWLFGAVNQNGHGPDILVQCRRDKAAAKKFFRKLLKGWQYVPRVIVTDKLKSYGASKRGVLKSGAVFSRPMGSGDLESDKAPLQGPILSPKSNHTTLAHVSCGDPIQARFSVKSTVSILCGLI
jgi:hypothetical protein